MRPDALNRQTVSAALIRIAIGLLLAAPAAYPQTPAGSEPAPAPASSAKSAPAANTPAQNAKKDARKDSPRESKSDDDDDAAAVKKAPRRFEPTDKGKADEDIPFPADI